MTDTIEMALNLCARAHALAAVAWLSVDYGERPSRDAANEVEVARRCTEWALAAGEKIAVLMPEKVVEIKAHCRDAEAIAAVDWHMDAAHDMVDALVHWKETHK